MFFIESASVLLYLLKNISLRMISCKIYEIFRNKYFTEHLQATGFALFRAFFKDDMSFSFISDAVITFVKTLAT